MSEIINGLSEKEKDVIEIAQKLTDYLIEKEQINSNEYIGKVEKVDRLEIASKLARNLREKGEELQEKIVKDLQEDFKKIEPVKENYYHMCKLLKLIIEVKDLEPIREIEIVNVKEQKTYDEYKSEIAYFLGTNNLLVDMDMDEFNDEVKKIADRFLESNTPYLQDFLNESFKAKNEIYKIESAREGEVRTELVKVLSTDDKKVEVQSIKDGYRFYYNKNFFENNKQLATKEDIENYKFKINKEDINNEKVEILNTELVGGYNNTSVYNLKIKINEEDPIVITAEKQNFDMQEPNCRWEITDKTHNLKPEIYDEIIKKLDNDYIPVTEEFLKDKYKEYTKEIDPETDMSYEEFKESYLRDVITFDNKHLCLENDEESEEDEL